MYFFANNIVPLCMLASGALLSAVMSIIRSSMGKKTTETECCSELVHLIGKYLTLSSFIMIMFSLSGAVTQTKILQAGILATISLVLSKLHCYYHMSLLKNIETEYIDTEAVRELQGEEKLTLTSFFMLLWVFLTILETMSVFICSFYGFEKMWPVIALSVVVFVAESFFGIAFIDLINQILEKINNIRKPGGNG